MNELHLFAGAGGGILGGMLLGHTTVCAVEIEPYCRDILLQRQRDGILPQFPIWDDVRTFDGRPWKGKVDVVCGGFPCTDISTAYTGEGSAKGLDGGRSGLWSDMARIIREVRPKFCIVENSPALTSRGLGKVLGDLAAMGLDARWGMLRASDCGGDILRKRIWIAAGSNFHGLQRFINKLQKASNRGNIAITALDTQQEVRLERHILSTPAVVRKSNDVAHRVDRTKAIGNGQVPAVAALAWEILTL